MRFLRSGGPAAWPLVCVGLLAGRDTNPSVQVLESLARVLRLDDVEAEHLMRLGAPRPRRRPPTRQAERAPARVHDLLAVLGIPAFVENRFFDVLAANPLAIAFSPRLAPGNNRLRSLLLDPAERDFQDDWDMAVGLFVAAFRRSIGDDTADPRTIELVGELSLASARFRALWARHDVRRLDGGMAAVHHPELGPLRLHREKLPVGDLILVVSFPEAGGEHAEKLAMLASLAASESA